MDRIRKKLCATALLASLGGGAIASPILWIGDSDGTLGKVDVASGAVTAVGQMSTTMTDIAFDPSGNLWGISFGQLFTINHSTAATSLVGNLGASLNSLVFAADGTLYAANNRLYTINTSTGQATAVGGTGNYSSSGDLAFVGGGLYLSSTVPASDSLFLLNVSTGVGTNVGSIGYSAVYGMATDNNVDLYGLSGNTILRINTATGAGTAVQSYTLGQLGQAYGTAFLTEAGAPPTSLPEPLSGSLVGLGLAALAASRYNKRRRT